MWQFRLDGLWILTWITQWLDSQSSHIFSFVFLSKFDMCFSLYMCIPSHPQYIWCHHILFVFCFFLLQETRNREDLTVIQASDELLKRELYTEKFTILVIHSFNQMMIPQNKYFYEVHVHHSALVKSSQCFREFSQIIF